MEINKHMARLNKCVRWLNDKNLDVDNSMDKHSSFKLEAIDNLRDAIRRVEFAVDALENDVRE